MPTDLSQEDALEATGISDIVRARQLLAGLGFSGAGSSWTEAARFEWYNTLSEMAFGAAMRADQEPPARAAVLIEEVCVLEAAMRLVNRNRVFSGEFLATLAENAEPGDARNGTWECDKQWSRH